MFTMYLVQGGLQYKRCRTSKKKYNLNNTIELSLQIRPLEALVAIITILFVFIHYTEYFDNILCTDIQLAYSIGRSVNIYVLL